MTPRPLAPGLCLVLGLGLGAAACESGPSKHELYMQGMQVEGEASRSDCQPAFDAGMDTHVLDGDVVQACLRSGVALEVSRRNLAQVRRHLRSRL